VGWAQQCFDDAPGVDKSVECPAIKKHLDILEFTSRGGRMRGMGLARTNESNAMDGKSHWKRINFA